MLQSLPRTDAPRLEPTPSRCLSCSAFSKVLLVQDQGEIDPLVREALEAIGRRVTAVLPVPQALAETQEFDCEFALWDSHQADRADALWQLRRKCPALPVIVLGNGSAESAIECMKAGAHDFLPQHFQPVQLQQAVVRAVRARRLFCAAALLPECASTGRAAQRLIGSSPAMQEVYKQIGVVAGREELVLIQGETGTGKELVARAIHDHSRRRERPFVAINCAAMPETLLESELFGHEAGAFTGATRRHPGAFEQAQGGTLFLDEIGDMSLPLQARLLRVLQQQEVHRVGGTGTIQVDVRLLAATNKILERMMLEGRFREDLYYRLHVVALCLPPLRDHPEDLLELTEHFIDLHTPPGEPRPALDALAFQKLQAYPWPGNVRELENVIRRALVIAREPAILEADIVLGELAGAGRLLTPLRGPDHGFGQ